MKKKGFTMAELLIVVAIVAILAAIAVPLLIASVERTAVQVDIANARAIRAMLVEMVSSGEITFDGDVDKGKEGGIRGVWVLVCKGSDYRPKGYSPDSVAGRNMLVDGSEAVFCGANAGVSVRGELQNNWNDKNTNLQQAVRSCFGNHEMKSMSAGFVGNVGGDNYGWDWYIVEIIENMDTGEFEYHLFSGKKDTDSDVTKNANSNIDKFMRGDTRAGYR